jgi:hypothetical protein
MTTSNISFLREFDQQFHENSKPIYDNYKTESEEGSEEDVDELIPVRITKGNFSLISFSSSKSQKEDISIINGAEKSKTTQR